MNPLSKSDLKYLQAAHTEQVAKFAGKVVASGHAELLPFSGLTIEQAPYIHYLREKLIVASDSPLHEVMRLAAGIALYTPRTETVLICGPTGVGKETFARMFAQSGKDTPFMAINCTGLPDYLVESELFGHVMGAFTGAIRDKVGLFSAAKNGVVLLDEVGDLPLSLQPKLLRAIQERRVRPVGSNTEHAIDCRIVCATHQNLLNRETFREDLYWRISTHVIEIPPLFSRWMDVVAYCKHYEFPVAELEEPTEVLEYHHLMLPGNYRQLQQLVARYRLRNKLSASGTPTA